MKSRTAQVRKEKHQAIITEGHKMSFKCIQTFLVTDEISVMSCFSV